MFLAQDPDAPQAQDCKLSALWAVSTGRHIAKIHPKNAQDHPEVIGFTIQTRPESHSGQMQTKAQDPKTVDQMAKLTHAQVSALSNDPVFAGCVGYNRLVGVHSGVKTGDPFSLNTLYIHTRGKDGEGRDDRG